MYTLNFRLTAASFLVVVLAGALSGPEGAIAALGAAVVALGLLWAFLRAPRTAFSVVLAVLMLPLIVAIAHAADAAAPETVAQATSDTTKVTWAWGAVVSQWANAIAWLVISGVSVLAARLGGTFGAVLSNQRVQTLIANGVRYAINAVDDATVGKTMTVEVGNAVLAKALQYALENSSTWLQNWAGGPLGIAKKIWAMLNLGEGANDAELEAIVTDVVAKVGK